MEFKDWEPLYLDILGDFGFSRERDEEAAYLLEALALRKPPCDDRCLSSIIHEKVTVCGDAPNLPDHLNKCRAQGTVIAADGATSALCARGIRPDIIVTDLDGDIDPQLKANSAGSVAVIHAHGDNMPELGQYGPLFRGRVVMTTQSSPFRQVRNYGGFTDGDRAVVLARHFGAQQIFLLGFDFLHPKPKKGKDPEVKLRKLAWARRIIFDQNPRQVSLWIP